MHNSLVRRVLPAAACAALALGIMPPAQAAPDVSCGSILLVDTVLMEDLTCGAGDGLVLGAPGITLDLDGHTITGAGVGTSAGGIRVRPGADGTTVRGGTVSGFTEGIVIDSSAWTSVTGMKVTGTERGINLANASWSTISRNEVSGSQLDGIRVDGWGSVGNQVTRNTVSRSNFIALTVSNGARGTEVSRNVVEGGEFGIAVFASATETKLMRNSVTGTAVAGISVHSGPSWTRVQRNMVTAGSGIGIRVGEPGTPVASETRVDWNVVTGYGDDAIVVDGTGAEDTTLFRNLI
jgi:parallel beta-helix repeat protein